MLNSKNGICRLGAKSLMWVLGVRVMLLVVGTQCVFVAHGQSRKDYPAPTVTLEPVGGWTFYYDLSLREMSNYFVPAWVGIRSYTVETTETGHRLTVQFPGSIPTRIDGLMTVEIYFGEYAIVYSGGSYTYRSTPPIESGRAGIVSFTDGAYLQTMAIPVTVQGSNLMFDVPTSSPIDWDSIWLLVVRYLPSSVDPTRVGGGFQSCVVDFVNLTASHIPLPPHPPHESLRALPNQGEQTDIFVFYPPPGYKPGDRTWNCPPTPRDSRPRPSDLDGNGRKDWDYPIDLPVDNGKMIDLRGLDKDETDDRFVLFVGTDSNSNGRLDDDEIETPIGECPTLGGLNFGYLDDRGYVHWENTDPQTGAKRHFIYDPRTGGLKVYLDPNGKGPAPGRKVYPPARSGQEWGNPNGYRWDWKNYN